MEREEIKNKLESIKHEIGKQCIGIKEPMEIGSMKSLYQELKILIPQI